MEIEGNADLFVHLNIWPIVLEFIPTITRPRLSEVSKSWRDLVAGSWRVFEVALTQQQAVTTDEFNQRIGDMIDYLIFHSRRLVDINIKLHFRNNSRKQSTEDDSVDNWLSRLLGIRTLKRLNFEIFPRSTSTVSIDISDIACTGLELLNLSTIRIESSALDELLLKLPKLVELYLDVENRITSAKQLRKLTKLQRLLANTKAYGDIVAACPSLKYLIRAGSKPWISSLVDNTLILSSEAFELETLADIEHTKRVLPLLTGYCATCDNTMIPMLTYLAMDPVRYQELIDLLVKEGKFDLNAGPPSFLYRPTFSKDFPKVDATYPLEIALQTNKVEFAKKLIALGAKAEHPDPTQSFITIAKSGETLKLLVDHGADLHKLLNFQEKKGTTYTEKFPAFMVPILQGKDYRKYIDSIKSRVDVNIVVNGRSFLEWSIVKGCWDTYISLLDAGAKWTSGALYSLLTYAPDRFGRVVTKKNFDLELITPKMATLAVQQGYAHLLTSYFDRYPNALDENGFGCIHYITLLDLQDPNDYSPHIYIPSENNTRWVVPKTRGKLKGSEKDDEHDGWSYDEAIEGWGNEKEEGVEEGEAMLIDEATEIGEDISLDAPRKFKKAGEKNKGGSPEEEHWNEQEVVEIEASGVVNPFAYKVEAKPLKTFVEALDLLHGDFNLTSKDGESALLLLCQSDMKPERKVGRLKALLAKHADVRVPDKHGWTPLHAACYKQDLKVFEMLLQAGADINACDKFGNSPLLVGFQTEYPQLTEWGEDASFEELTRFYWRALQLTDNLGIKTDLNATHVVLKKKFIHYIATLGTPKFLRYIADRVDINSQDANGLTPLHHAVLMNNSLSVRQLLKLGADPNIPTHSLKMTPAMLFMHILTKGKFSKDEPYADEERFGNPLMRIQWFESPYAMWLTTNETLLEAVYRVRHIEKHQGERILCLAALKDAPWLEYAQAAQKYNYANRLRLRNVENLLHLLLQHSDLTKIDSHGNTYLHLAVKYHTRPGCLWNIETLLAYFPQLNTQWNIKNDYNDTPFSLMCRACEHFKGFVPAIKSVLKQHEVDVSGTDSHGHSPAHYLISHVTDEDDLIELELPQGWSSVTMCHPPTTIVDLLLQDKDLTRAKLVDVLATNSSVLMARDSLGRTFLMRILQGLFEQNVSHIGWQSYQGKMSTDVSFPVQSNYWPYLDVLLRHKEHLNIQDNNGNTALHMACKYFHLGLVESILGKINNTRYSERFFVTAFKLLEAGSDPSIKNKRGETPLDYVPHLHEYHQELYCNWIKQLDYKDDMTITYEGQKAIKQQLKPSQPNTGADWDFVQSYDDDEEIIRNYLEDDPGVFLDEFE